MSWFRHGEVLISWKVAMTVYQKQYSGEVAGIGVRNTNI